jgi:hypothetical protein
MRLQNPGIFRCITVEPEDDVLVARYVENSAELFDIDGVRAQQGHAALEMYAEEAADDKAQGNGAVRGEGYRASLRPYQGSYPKSWGTQICDRAIYGQSRGDYDDCGTRS